MAGSHVKNPLSVIAIFAGLAELGGTAILPLIHESVQATYVWFLMLFPTLIVALFFGTLWCAHWKLYAPSDFSDESNWVAAAGDAISRKYREEASEAAKQVDEAADFSTLDTPPLASGSNSQSDIVTEQNTPITSLPEVPAAIEETQSIDNARWVDMARYTAAPASYLAAEELAFLKVSEEFGPFKRHVSPANRPRIIFDGVQIGNGKTTVLEVKYVRSDQVHMRLYKDTVDRIANFVYSLPLRDQNQFTLILAIVSETTLDERQKVAVKRRIEEAHSFKIVTRFYVMTELENGVFG